MKTDAISAYHWLRGIVHPDTDILIHGHSLGTGVAAQLGSYLNSNNKHNGKRLKHLNLIKTQGRQLSARPTHTRPAVKTCVVLLDFEKWGWTTRVNTVFTTGRLWVGLALVNQ